MSTCRSNFPPWGSGAVCIWINCFLRSIEDTVILQLTAGIAANFIAYPGAYDEYVRINYA
jgi:hypothetical protein